jgi:hypothetical protein
MSEEVKKEVKIKEKWEMHLSFHFHDARNGGWEENFTILEGDVKRVKKFPTRRNKYGPGKVILYPIGDEALIRVCNYEWERTGYNGEKKEIKQTGYNGLVRLVKNI